jgi:hypothetical protein
MIPHHSIAILTSSRAQLRSACAQAGRRHHRGAAPGNRRDGGADRRPQWRPRGDPRSGRALAPCPCPSPCPCSDLSHQITARENFADGMGSSGSGIKTRVRGTGNRPVRGGRSGIGAVSRAPPVTDFPRLPGTGGLLLLRRIILSLKRFRPVQRVSRTRPLPACAGTASRAASPRGLVRPASQSGRCSWSPASPPGTKPHLKRRRGRQSRAFRFRPSHDHPQISSA